MAHLMNRIVFSAALMLGANLSYAKKIEIKDIKWGSTNNVDFANNSLVDGGEYHGVLLTLKNGLYTAVYTTVLEQDGGLHREQKVLGDKLRCENLNQYEAKCSYDGRVRDANLVVLSFKPQIKDQGEKFVVTMTVTSPQNQTTKQLLATDAELELYIPRP